jgi:hypothetical protein
MRDVIVLLPGITGTVLRKDGKDVWAPSLSTMVKAFASGGKSIQELALADDPLDVDDLRDGITADALVPDIHLIPGLWKIDGYTKIIQRIQTAFDVTLGKNFFPFPYDWRRDNRVSARKLARSAHEWLKHWREGAGGKDAKLILLAHSMGGVIARYFLECMDGWRDTRFLITFGTPFQGSLNALDFIANGYTKGGGRVDLSPVLRSLTSIYQLLPTFGCCDLGDGKIVRVAETSGIPKLSADRAARALAFHQEITSAVNAHLRDQAYLENRYRMIPVVGVYQRTLQFAKLADGKLQVLDSAPSEERDGDGTVPSDSAVPEEIRNEDRARYVSEIHGSLQNSTAVLDDIVSLLKESRRSPRRDERPYVSLAIDDFYTTKEPIRLSGRTAEPQLELTVLVADVNHPSVVRKTTRAVNGQYSLQLPPLPEGDYRLTVRSATFGDLVSDVFIVVAA